MKTIVKSNEGQMRGNEGWVGGGRGSRTEREEDRKDIWVGGGERSGGRGQGEKQRGGRGEGFHRVLLAANHRSEPVTDQDSFDHFEFAAEFAHQADLCPGRQHQLCSHTEGVQKPPRLGHQLDGILLLRGQMPATARTQKPSHLNCKHSVLTRHSAVLPSASRNTPAEGQMPATA